MPSLTHCQIKIWPRKCEKESRLILRLPISMRSGWMLTDDLRIMETIWTVDTAGLRQQKKDWKSSGGVVQQTRRLEDLEREVKNLAKELGRFASKQESGSVFNKPYQRASV